MCPDVNFILMLQLIFKTARKYDKLKCNITLHHNQELILSLTFVFPELKGKFWFIITWVLFL